MFSWVRIGDGCSLMDWYSLIKLLHVISAIIWLGGGFALVVLGIAGDRARDDEAVGRIVDHVIFLTPRLLMPAAIGAFTFGAIATWMVWSLSYLWIWIGLVGFASTFVMGFFVLRPRSEAFGKVTAAEGYSDRAIAMARDLLAHAKFDYVMMFIVVADMVFKPSLNDWPLLIVFAGVLVAGAATFLLPAMRKGEQVDARMPASP
jgi:uncharacterized membrane protein